MKLVRLIKICLNENIIKAVRVNICLIILVSKLV
jgi:hypothetical protein